MSTSTYTSSTSTSTQASSTSTSNMYSSCARVHVQVPSTHLCLCVMLGCYHPDSVLDSALDAGSVIACIVVWTISSKISVVVASKRRAVIIIMLRYLLICWRLCYLHDGLNPPLIIICNKYQYVVQTHGSSASSESLCLRINRVGLQWDLLHVGLIHLHW